jgi:hypothetical protein
VILRPAWLNRWGTSLFLIALASWFLGLGIRDWITHGYELWFPAGLALVIAALGVLYWRMYIRADDTTIVVGFAGTRRYDRREVAAIQTGRFVISYLGSGRRVRFLRSDGSVVFTTYFYWWGKDQLNALATYLGVPIEQL